MTMACPSPDWEEYPRLRVGMCQVFTRPWDVEGNLSRTLQALRLAADRGAQLAITPEVVLQGYPPPITPADRVRLMEVAEPLDGPHLVKIRQLASGSGMDVVVGFAEKAGGVIHNSCAYIDGGGEVRAVYRKVHCRPFEDANHQGVYQPGEDFLVVDKQEGASTHRIGLMICFDREIPESVRCLRAQGATFIACPLATNTSRLAAPLSRADNEMLTRARAAENEVYIAVVNHAGNYNGGSFLVGPTGELIHQMDRDPGVAVIDVPVGIVPAVFHADPLGWAGWGYRRPNVYRRYLQE